MECKDTVIVSGALNSKRYDKFWSKIYTLLQSGASSELLSIPLTITSHRDGLYRYAFSRARADANLHILATAPFEEDLSQQDNLFLKSIVFDTHATITVVLSRPSAIDLDLQLFLRWHLCRRQWPVLAVDYEIAAFIRRYVIVRDRKRNRLKRILSGNRRVADFIPT